MDRSGPVGSRSKTDQPVLLSVNTDKRGNAPNDPVGHDVMLAETRGNGGPARPGRPTQ